jgi:hypothetical protein
MADIEQSAAALLNSVSDIVKRYEERWRWTGGKYNIFQVADIADQEVIMCRVLADLLNPQGRHCKGSRYLRLFWEQIALKWENCPALAFEQTRVTVEYVIEWSRRIDIALEDGVIFVPIEVKIRARDQDRQVADYFAFAKKQNNTVHIPVLYLTLNGREPPDYSKVDLTKEDYVRLSFKGDILPWLEACLNDEETKNTVPVRENLKQLIAAIQYLCGQSEEAKMDNDIIKAITEDADRLADRLCAFAQIRNANARKVAERVLEKHFLPTMEKLAKSLYLRVDETSYSDEELYEAWDENEGWFIFFSATDAARNEKWHGAQPCFRLVEGCFCHGLYKKGASGRDFFDEHFHSAGKFSQYGPGGSGFPIAGGWFIGKYSGKHLADPVFLAELYPGCERFLKEMLAVLDG